MSLLLELCTYSCRKKTGHVTVTLHTLALTAEHTRSRTHAHMHTPESGTPDRIKNRIHYKHTRLRPDVIDFSSGR